MFFNYELFESKLREVLIRNDSKFILTSRCIYIYPNKKLDLDNSLELLSFTTNKLLMMISLIEQVIVDFE